MLSTVKSMNAARFHDSYYNTNRRQLLLMLWRSVEAATNNSSCRNDREVTWPCVLILCSVRLRWGALKWQVLAKLWSQETCIMCRRRKCFAILCFKSVTRALDWTKRHLQPAVQLQLILICIMKANVHWIALVCRPCLSRRSRSAANLWDLHQRHSDIPSCGDTSKLWLGSNQRSYTNGNWQNRHRHRHADT